MQGKRKKRRDKTTTMTKTEITRGVINGTITLIVSDIGATSTEGTPAELFEPSNPN